MGRKRYLRLSLAFALCLAYPAQLFSAQLVCSGGGFSVGAPTDQLGEEICGILAGAETMMSDCGLKQTRHIAVEVVQSIAHPVGVCLAYFDCEYDTIEVTDPAAFAELLPADNPYALLPPKILLRALVAHELAHALTTQSAGDRQVDIVDQEYIAAALELEFLDTEWRELLVQAAPVSLPPKEGLIDKWIYGMAPRKFATNAWQHFRQEEHRCGLVMKIVEGQFSFRK